jgi:16S rRNA (uracil1498-N3)-methyltransferase
MGVGGIIPLFTERTEVRISTEKVRGKLAKWKKLAVEACKQSGNPWLPEIEAPIKFGELPLKKEQACFIASLRSRSRKSLPALETSSSEFLLFIGPEGGWTQREEEIASDKGAVPFSLGPNVLRSETAALCALAVARAGFLD